MKIEKDISNLIVLRKSFEEKRFIQMKWKNIIKNIIYTIQYIICY